MNKLKDIFYLHMAYGLAEKAKGWASPNPYVGSVIVKKNVILGCGYHEKPGKPHAEAIAIQKAGSSASNSTAYITLEPCTHWGRTPPCVDSIIKAHIKRVVVSSLDPNPLVYKKGIKKMKKAGIDVSVGLLKEKNSRLNETYIKYITKKIPFVTVKAAVSLDGKMATKTFVSQWISSPQTREYFNLLRGEYDAIMTGINTLIKDDPRLTVRHPNWKDKRITRIILDSNLRFPPNSRILNTLPQGKIIVFTGKLSSKQKADNLRKKGVEIIFQSSFSSNINLKEVLSWLGKQEISSILVEGGSSLTTSFLEQRLTDKIFVTLSPKLIGGKDAPSLLQGEGVNFIKDSLHLKKIEFFQIEDDIITEGYF